MYTIRYNLLINIIANSKARWIQERLIEFVLIIWCAPIISTASSICRCTQMYCCCFLFSIFGMEVRCCSITSTAIRYLMMQIWLSLVNDTGIHPASCRVTYALSFDAYKGCMNDSLKNLTETLKFGVQSWSIKEPWHHTVPSPLNEDSQFQPFHTSTTPN